MTTFSCTNITRQYLNFCLDNVSFSMETGYFYVLVGVTGSGKTTLLDCISGVYISTHRSMSGEAQIDGISLNTSPETYRRRLGYISEKCPFFMEESIAQSGLTLRVECTRGGACAGDTAAVKDCRELIRLPFRLPPDTDFQCTLHMDEKAGITVTCTLPDGTAQSGGTHSSANG